jgi:hypothetical protein
MKGKIDIKLCLVDKILTEVRDTEGQRFNLIKFLLIKLISLLICGVTVILYISIET